MKALNQQIINGTIVYGTGITDKNGNEMFEGDIVALRTKKGKTTSHQVILWDDNTASFRLSCGSIIKRREFMVIVGHIFTTEYEHLTSGRVRLS